MKKKVYKENCSKCHGTGEFHYGGSFGGAVHYAECDCWVEAYVAECNDWVQSYSAKLKKTKESENLNKE